MCCEKNLYSAVINGSGERHGVSYGHTSIFCTDNIIFVMAVFSAEESTLNINSVQDRTKQS